jgi:hypothetical protein
MKAFTLKSILQHFKLNPKTIIVVFTITLAILLGCSHTENTLAILLGCSHTEKVRLPPKVTLKPYNHIGVIEFSTNAEDNLKPYVTQNFIHNLQSAQPGTRIIELGSEAQLLRTMKCSMLMQSSLVILRFLK